MVLMPGFQSTRLATEGALEPFLFLYTDDSIQGNPETCNQSSMMLNYEVKNTLIYGAATHANQALDADVTELLADCTSKERAVILESARQIKKALRQEI